MKEKTISILKDLGIVVVTGLILNLIYPVIGHFVWGEWLTPRGVLYKISGNALVRTIILLAPFVGGFLGYLAWASVDISLKIKKANKAVRNAIPGEYRRLMLIRSKIGYMVVSTDRQNNCRYLMATADFPVLDGLDEDASEEKGLEFLESITDDSAWEYKGYVDDVDAWLGTDGEDANIIAVTGKELVRKE